MMFEPDLSESPLLLTLTTQQGKPQDPLNLIEQLRAEALEQNAHMGAEELARSLASACAFHNQWDRFFSLYPNLEAAALRTATLLDAMNCAPNAPEEVAARIQRLAIDQAAAQLSGDLRDEGPSTQILVHRVAEVYGIDAAKPFCDAVEESFEQSLSWLRENTVRLAEDDPFPDDSDVPFVDEVLLEFSNVLDCLDTVSNYDSFRAGFYREEVARLVADLADVWRDHCRPGDDDVDLDDAREYYMERLNESTELVQALVGEAQRATRDRQLRYAADLVYAIDRILPESLPANLDEHVRWSQIVGRFDLIAYKLFELLPDQNLQYVFTRAEQRADLTVRDRDLLSQGAASIETMTAILEGYNDAASMLGPVQPLPIVDSLRERLAVEVGSMSALSQFLEPVELEQLSISLRALGDTERFHNYALMVLHREGPSFEDFDNSGTASYLIRDLYALKGEGREDAARALAERIHGAMFLSCRSFSTLLRDEELESDDASEALDYVSCVESEVRTSFMIAAAECGYVDLAQQAFIDIRNQIPPEDTPMRHILLVQLTDALAGIPQSL